MGLLIVVAVVVVLAAIRALVFRRPQHGFVRPEEAGAALTDETMSRDRAAGQNPISSRRRLPPG